MNQGRKMFNIREFIKTHESRKKIMFNIREFINIETIPKLMNQERKECLITDNSSTLKQFKNS